MQPREQAMKITFTAAEKTKIAAVLAAQQAKFEAGINCYGYNNSNGGCPNCGDIGGHFAVMYELRKMFGIRSKP
jgi:hypothetical protein